MSFTLFGVIWIIILIFCFLSCSFRYSVLTLLFAMIFQSNNVLLIGEVGVGPQLITSLVFIIKCVCFRAKISKKYMTLLILFLIQVLYIFITTYYNDGGIELEKFLYILQLLIYMLCTFLIIEVAKDLPYGYVNKCITNVGIFILIIGIIQFLMSSGIIPKLNIMNYLIYSDNSTTVAWNGGDYVSTGNARLYSVFMEPSYCSGFLNGYLFFVLEQNLKTRKKLVISICTIIEIILTRSTTAYVTLCIVLVIYMLLNKNFKLTIAMLITFFLMFIILYFGFNDLLNEVIFDKASSGSNAERTKWNLNAWETFLASPILGGGYKNSRASTIILSMLGEQGIVGSLIYVIIIVYLLKVLYKNKQMAPALFLIAVLVAQAIACPDYDYCVFWFSIYALCGNLIRGKKRYVRYNYSRL